MNNLDDLVLCAPGRLFYASGLTHSQGIGEPVYTRASFSAARFSDRGFAERMGAILLERTGIAHTITRFGDAIYGR